MSEDFYMTEDEILEYVLSFCTKCPMNDTHGGCLYVGRNIESAQFSNYCLHYVLQWLR